MQAEARPSLSEPVTLALHFLLPTGRRRSLDQPEVVATRLVERVLRCLMPLQMRSGSVILRAAPLVQTDFSTELALAWYETVTKARCFHNGSMLLFGLDQRPDLRRAFVVTISGRLGSGFQENLGRKLKRFEQNQLILILPVDPNERVHELLYRGPLMPSIGELRADQTFEVSFDAVEYFPAMPQMLQRLLEKTVLSSFALREVERMVAMRPT